MRYFSLDMKIDQWDKKEGPETGPCGHGCFTDGKGGTGKQCASADNQADLTVCTGKVTTELYLTPHIKQSPTGIQI